MARKGYSGIIPCGPLFQTECPMFFLGITDRIRLLPAEWGVPGYPTKCKREN